jgi:hypothetical protein
MTVADLQKTIGEARSNYLNKMINMEVSMTIKEEYYHPKAPVASELRQSIAYFGKENTDFAIEWGNKDKTDKFDSVVAGNSKYYFELRKEKEEDISSNTNGNEWILKEYILYETRLRNDETIYVDYQKIPRTGGYDLAYFMGIIQLLEFPEFKIISIKSTDENQNQSVTINFECHPTVKPQKGVYFSDGILVFRPDKYWMIENAVLTLIDCTGEVSEPVQLTITCKFSEESNLLIPFISEHNILLSFVKTNDKIRSAYKTININAVNLERSRFTLSHYGLPEPDFGERRTNRIRYIIMGLGLLLIGWGLWRLIQKQRKQT